MPTWNSIYCRFSSAGTWELVNLFVGTKKISYHICYENRPKTKQNTLKSTDRQTDRQTDRPWTDKTEQYASKEECIKINQEGTFTQGFKDCREIKRKVSQNLDLLIKFEFRENVATL